MGWLYVFLGGGLGSLARYGVARWLPPAETVNGDFPWATLVANLLACIVLGIGVGLTGRELLERPAQLFLLTGFCGGFSTFSTYALELLLLGEEWYTGTAVVYLLASTIGGILALWIALSLTR